MVFGDQIVSLFLSPSSAIFGESVTALKKYAWGFLFMGINVVAAAFFTSVEKAGYSFPISMGRGLVFPAAAVLGVFILQKGEMIWFCGAAAEGMCLALTVVLMGMYGKNKRI